MAAHEMAVLVDAREPARAERRSLIARKDDRLLRTEELPGAGPIDESDRELEARAPVCAERVRTFGEPRVDEPLAAFRKTRLAREMPRLGERHELEVAIHFPQVLYVADRARRVVVECLAESERRAGAGLRIDVPGRREAERRAVERKHVERARENAVGRSRVSRGIESAGQLAHPGRARPAGGKARVCPTQAGALGARARGPM